MTPQEEQLLQSLTERVNSTQLQEKDPDAEAFLNQSFGSNPDALYILAQTVLVQNIALDQAKAQVAQLQQEAQEARQPARATSFLGNLLGHRDAQPAPPPMQAAQPQFQPVPQPQYIPSQPQYIPPQAQYVPVTAGPPSFLRGAMQTAAGVAAGALAFEGVEAALHGIMGHPGFGGGYGWGGPGMGMMGGGFERPVEETVVNNYYDQPGGEHEHREQLNQDGFGQASLDQGTGEPHFHESADRNFDQNFDRNDAQLTDASYNPQGGDRAGFDDSNQDSNQDLGQNDGAGFDDGSQDDSSLADSGSFDDGGGFDGGGGGDSSFG